MSVSWTLSRYLARQFLISVGLVFALCLTLGFVIDIVELLPDRNRKTEQPSRLGWCQTIDPQRTELLIFQLHQHARRLGVHRPGGVLRQTTLIYRASLAFWIFSP